MRRRLVLRLATSATIAAILALIARRRLMRVEVAGESMTPALQPGDFLFVRLGIPRRVAAGDVVAVVDPRPEANRRILLKRVVGLPGEALRVGGGVQVNGRILDEPYAHGETPSEQHRGINRLADDEYFVMGDHRGASTDSRDFGPVSREAILGVAWLRYWPPERVGFLHRPERRLLGVAGGPGPHAHPLPDAGSQPLPWLGTRVAPPPDDAP